MLQTKLFLDNVKIYELKNDFIEIISKLSSCNYLIFIEPGIMHLNMIIFNATYNVHSAQVYLMITKNLRNRMQEGGAMVFPGDIAHAGNAF